MPETLEITDGAEGIRTPDLLNAISEKGIFSSSHN